MAGGAVVVVSGGSVSTGGVTVGGGVTGVTGAVGSGSVGSVGSGSVPVGKRLECQPNSASMATRKQHMH